MPLVHTFGDAVNWLDIMEGLGKWKTFDYKNKTMMWSYQFQETVIDNDTDKKRATEWNKRKMREYKKHKIK